jgi:hypothetical protein
MEIESLNELVSVMVKSACKFIEFYSPEQIHYYRCYGYNGSIPQRFHPGVGDRFILRRLMFESAKDIPKNFWN